jgi:hypothetical protein
MMRGHSNGVPVFCRKQDAAFEVRGQGGYHTTPSGKTIVHHPSAYKWRTVYHASTLEVNVNPRFLARLERALASGRRIDKARLKTDALAIKNKAGVIIRYNADLRPCGRAIPMPADLRDEYGPYEHGITLADCRREIAHKRKAVAQRKLEAALAKRQERFARLFARVATNAHATVDDARAAGYCTAGIQAWCTERGVDPTGAVPLATLAHDADRRAQTVALLVARKIARQTGEARQ